MQILCLSLINVMGRIISIDYGQKKVGLAVTDPDQIIATNLGTVHVKEIFHFLKQYFSNEKVDCAVIGDPRQMNNHPSNSAKFIEPFVKKFMREFPDVEIQRVDERFTTKMAKQTIIMSGAGKKTRQNKELVDSVSATIILQSYLEQIKP